MQLLYLMFLKNIGSSNKQDPKCDIGGICMDELLKNLQDHMERYGYARLYPQELELIREMHQKSERMKDRNIEYETYRKCVRGEI
jgi:hypothetical protein